MTSLTLSESPHFSSSDESSDDSDNHDSIMNSLLQKSSKRHHQVFSKDHNSDETDDDAMQVGELSPHNDHLHQQNTDPAESTTPIEYKKPEYAFTITCKIGSDSEEERNAELLRKIERKDRKRRKRLEKDENAQWIMSKGDLMVAEHLQRASKASAASGSSAEEMPRSITGVKIIQPFDYDQLKKHHDTTGVIYVEKPMAKEFQNKRALKGHFSEYGEVTRIETDLILKGKKRIVRGFFVEFSSKDLAKRIALTLNNAPISRRDSRTLIMRYLDNFSWSSVQDDFSKKLMLRKLMRAQATNELKAIQTFEKRKKLSNALKKQAKTKRQQAPQKAFRFQQKKFRDYVTKESNHHIDFMPFLGSS